MEGPIYATEVRSGRSAWLIGLALLAGLALGGFFIYRWPPGKAEEASQSSAAVTATISSSTRTTEAPRTLTNKQARLRRTEPSVVSAEHGAQPPTNARAAAGKAPSSGNDFTPPVLLTPSGTHAPTVQMSRPAGQTQAPATTAPAAASGTARPGRAVQDPGADYSPMPTGVPAENAGASASDAARVAQPSGAASAPTLVHHATANETAVEPAPKPAYAGPRSGTATWTGRLEKNETLTITGGTPSKGILAGAGLPGVPVRITVEEKNLGFAEMPNAANGYRKLVLQSHTKHDKITIRWTVIE